MDSLLKITTVIANDDVFPWQPKSDYDCVQGTGMLVNHNGKDYIIVPRIPFCMGKSVTYINTLIQTNGSYAMTSNSIEVEYQTPYYGMGIMCSPGKGEFRASKVPQKGSMREISKAPSLKAYNINRHVMPKKNKKYVAVSYTFQDENKCTEKVTENVVYSDMVTLEACESQMFLGSVNLYRFTSENRVPNGAILIGPEDVVIGMVMYNDDSNVFVMPTMYIASMLVGFLNSVEGAMQLPFRYSVTGDGAIVVSENHGLLEKDDVITMINNTVPVISGKTIGMAGNAMKVLMKMDDYVMFHGTHTTLVHIKRGKTIRKVTVVNVPLDRYPLTLQPFTEPMGFPYVVINGLVVAPMTYDMCNVLTLRGIKPIHKIVNDILENKYEKEHPMFFIIDSLPGCPYERVPSIPTENQGRFVLEIIGLESINEIPIRSMIVLSKAMTSNVTLVCYGGVPLCIRE